MTNLLNTLKHNRIEFGRSRALLHRDKVESFADWAVSNGYRREDVRGDYEVLRLRKDSGSNRKLRNGFPLIYYLRDQGDHVTCFGEGLWLVETWINDRSRR